MGFRVKYTGRGKDNAERETRKDFIRDLCYELPVKMTVF